MSLIFIAKHGRILAGVFLRKTECKTVTKVTDSTESSLDVPTHTCNNPTETFHYTNFYAGRPPQLREIFNPPPPSHICWRFLEATRPQDMFAPKKLHIIGTHTVGYG